MSRKYVRREYQPERCWVGEQAKICYTTREEAEAAALVVEHDYGAPQLSVYHCPYGDHYHLSSKSKKATK